MSAIAAGPSREQAMEQLRRANEIRLARAELKRRLKRGELTARDVLDDPPSCVSSMAVFDLLRAQRRWGGVKAKRFLLSCQVGEGRSVGLLTERQRNALVYGLR